MSATNLRASTQNQEMEGTAAADPSQPPSENGLQGFAESVGIDLGQYFPFGIDIYISEPNYLTSTVDRAQIAILAVEMAVVGSGFSDIADYVNANGTLPYTRFNTQANLEDVLKYLKRVKITLLQRSIGNGSYEETQSIDL